MSKLLRAIVGKRTTSKPSMSTTPEPAVATPSSAGGEMDEVTEQTAALSLANGYDPDTVPFEVATFALS